MQQGPGAATAQYAPPAPAPAPSGAAQNEPQAITALVLGILGVTVCGILAPFAWNIGKKSLDNIRQHPSQYTGEGMAQAGYILGIIGSILLIIGVVVLFFYLIFAATLFASL